MDVQRCLLSVYTALCGICLTGTVVPARAAAADFQVTPAPVELQGNFAQTQLLVTSSETTAAAAGSDLTRAAHYVSSDPKVVEVAPTGRILATGNGTAQVTIEHHGQTRTVDVHVMGVVAQPQIGFATQIEPILSKAGCNAGACHASQFGKGGFKLSVFGYAPDEDYDQMVRLQIGRRVNLMEPERSLLLLKPTRTIPHGGNKRIDVGSVDYQILLAWLSGGAPAPSDKEPKVTSLRVAPDRRVGPTGFTQQLQVLATYSDGATRDVTSWAKYDSMDESVVQVDREGLVTSLGKGQAAIMVRFEGQADLATMVTPHEDAIELADWKDNNYIDALAVAKFKELGITPSPLCDDATFLRRAYLDAIGTLPTVQQTTAFLDSTEPDKRTRLVKELLGLAQGGADHRREYAAYWTLKWADLIRSSSRSAGERGMWSLYNWLKDSFYENKPFDKFVRELLTAKGSTFNNGPPNYFRIAKTPQDLAEATSQLFLGVRLQCAKCHHHPFEKYSQSDYYGFAACFSGISMKRSQEFGLATGEEVLVVRAGEEVRHPRTGERMKPTPLEGQPLAATGDARAPLADWLISTKNGFFARNVVNRYMAYLLGRGLVEPIDDLRATNPATNVPLMDRMAEEFARGGYNLKHLLRDIMTSRLYQLDSQPLPSNAVDDRFYSHYSVKRVPAEPLLDAIDQVTGVLSKFDNMPLGTRAIELPDADGKDYFLKTFGKPQRASVCECERVSVPNLSQSLNTLNGDIVARKISDSRGRLQQLLDARISDDSILTELYLSTLCRRPTTDEIAAGRKFRQASPDSKTFAEDLLWSLMNSKQFLFIH